MATKTVVCPECGTGAAPGRFACPECGALVAAVGGAPPRWATSEDVEPDEAETPTDALAPEALAEPDAVDGALDDAVEAGVDPVPDPVSDPSPAAEPIVAAVSTPVAAVAPAAEPDVPAVLAFVEPVADEEAEEAEDEPEPDAPMIAPSRVSAPVWPPEGATDPVPRPAPRSPAGAYLSPSTALAQTAAASAAIHRTEPAASPRDAATAAGHTAAAAATTEPGGVPRASVAETLDAFGITEDIPRRLIGAGAAVTALGFLLPWASVVAGTGLGGSYWTRWGLAGPGHWIIVGALVALVLLALGSGRFGHVPVGPIAIVLAGVVLGVLWPYLFGASDRFVGVWLVLAGTIVLGLGGILDVRRHDPEEPPV